jgi:hypothetical protein
MDSTKENQRFPIVSITPVDCFTIQSSSSSSSSSSASSSSHSSGPPFELDLTHLLRNRSAEEDEASVESIETMPRKPPRVPRSYVLPSSSSNSSVTREDTMNANDVETGISMPDSVPLVEEAVLTNVYANNRSHGASCTIS